MATALIPPPFRGQYNEDSQSWIETASWYILIQRTPTEKSKIALIGIMLQDEAKRWFLQLDIRDQPAQADGTDGGAQALPPNVITTFEQFRVRFLERFHRDQADLRREQAMIWSVKQRAGQSTQSFIDELQEVAARARAAPEQVLTAAIAGLRADVKTYCMAHEINDMQTLQRWAHTYESCMGSCGGGDMNAISSTVERLEKVLDKLQARAASPAPRAASPVHQVHFAEQGQVNNRHGYAGGERGYQGVTAPTMGASAGQPRRRGRGRPARRGFGPGWGQRGGRLQGSWYGNNQSPNPPTSTTSFQSTPRSYYSRGARREDYGVQRNDCCGNCGRFHAWGNCPAYGQACRGCSRVGHFIACCRSLNQQC